MSIERLTYDAFRRNDPAELARLQKFAREQIAARGLGPDIDAAEARIATAFGDEAVRAEAHERLREQLAASVALLGAL